MDYLFMALAIVLFTGQTLCFKGFSQRYMGSLRSYFVFNALYFGLVVAINLVLGFQPAGLHTATVLLAVSFGVLFIATMLMYFEAMKHGPLSYSALIMSFGLLVPILFGFFAWDEGVSPLQGMGLLLLLFTFFCITRAPREAAVRPSLRWVLLCLAAFAGNGALMTLMKAQQMILPGQEIREFLILAFGTAALLSFVLSLALRRGGASLAALKSPLFAGLAVGAGVTTAFGNQLNLILSSRLPSVILFPTVNGGLVMLSSLLSMWVFKEKITRAGALGLVLGIGALVLLSM